MKENTKIVILQYGWVLVGNFTRDNDKCFLENSSVVRVWGTEKGLGEIALNGPTKSTTLDPNNGLVEFDADSIVATLTCNGSKWVKSLK